jgi:phosphoglycolate phosphatase
MRQIGRLLVQRLRGARGLEHAIPEARKEPVERVSDAVFIVDDKNGSGRDRRSERTHGANVVTRYRPSKPRVPGGPCTIFHRMRLILFDIDGTLLWTDGAGRRAIHRALLAEAGTAGPIDDYRFDGKTDPQIVRELLTLAGHPDAAAPDRIAAVCGRYVAVLQEELDRAPEGTRLLTGVAALLGALESHESAGRAVVGLLTGNLKAGAELKLRAAGVEPGRFAVGAYGSDSGRRAELPAIAAQRATDLLHRRFAGADIVIIGDTPDDVACGRPIGARSVAVATGYYDATALQAAGATYVFESLADTAAVLDALLT